jgi:hypothetical protein
MASFLEKILSQLTKNMMTMVQLCDYFYVSVLYEEFDYTKGIIRFRTSKKNRQHNESNAFFHPEHKYNVKNIQFVISSKESSTKKHSYQD